MIVKILVEFFLFSFYFFKKILHIALISEKNEKILNIHGLQDICKLLTPCRTKNSEWILFVRKEKKKWQLKD